MVSLVDPTFEHLMSSSSEYVPGKEALELLFTGSFLQSMLKEAEQHVTWLTHRRQEKKREQGQEGRPERSNLPECREGNPNRCLTIQIRGREED